MAGEIPATRGAIIWVVRRFSFPLRAAALALAAQFLTADWAHAELIHPSLERTWHHASHVREAHAHISHHLSHSEHMIRISRGIFAAPEFVHQLGGYELHFAGYHGHSEMILAYLLARRALNPSRFDFYHHELGRLLARDALLRTEPTCSCPHHVFLYPTPYHRYLHARHSLNPERFDSNHPILGALLEEDDRVRQLPPCLPTIPAPPPFNPVAEGPPPPPNGNPPPPSTPPPPPPLAHAPEPSTLALSASAALAALARAGWKCSRGRRERLGRSRA